MIQDELAKRACKLCAANNGSGCTTPEPDLQHWICKAWLKKAATQDLREQIAQTIYQDDSWKRFFWKEWLPMADQILALIKEAGYVKLAESKAVPKPESKSKEVSSDTPSRADLGMHGYGSNWNDGGGRGR